MKKLIVITFLFLTVSSAFAECDMEDVIKAQGNTFDAKQAISVGDEQDASTALQEAENIARNCLGETSSLSLSVSGSNLGRVIAVKKGQMLIYNFFNDLLDELKMLMAIIRGGLPNNAGQQRFNNF